MDFEPATVHVSCHRNESKTRSSWCSKWIDHGDEGGGTELLQPRNLRNHCLHINAGLSIPGYTTSPDILLSRCELYKHVFHIQKFPGNSVVAVQGDCHSN